MHELTNKLLKEHCGEDYFERADKIITDWLEEKCEKRWESNVFSLRELKETFGLSKKSCRCGAWHTEGGFWVHEDGTSIPNWYSNLQCSCGDKLEVTP